MTRFYLFNKSISSI